MQNTYNSLNKTAVALVTIQYFSCYAVVTIS